MFLFCRFCTISRMFTFHLCSIIFLIRDEQALYDVICKCSLFNFYNRILDGHGNIGNDNLYKMGADHLFKNGYGVPWFIKFIKGIIRKSKIKEVQKLETKK